MNGTGTLIFGAFFLNILAWLFVMHHQASINQIRRALYGWLMFVISVAGAVLLLLAMSAPAAADDLGVTRADAAWTLGMAWCGILLLILLILIVTWLVWRSVRRRKP